MEAVEPKLFYTGLVASMYNEMRSQDPDPDPYERFIAACGEPALELGCGDGDPLLELRRRGVEVEGLDSSPDMVQRCRDRSEALGLEVVVYEQPIESMDIPRRYRSMYLAGPTFNLLPDDEVVRQSLQRMLVHLEPGGSALIPLFVPRPTPAAWIGRPREMVREDGDRLVLTATAEQRDDEQRRQVTVLRYELVSASGAAVTERPWLLHWHTQEGFRELAVETGFAVSAVLDPQGQPARPKDQEFVFLLTRSST